MTEMTAISEATIQRVLVVDDHRKIRKPLAEFLQRQGYAVDAVDSAAAMWAMLRGQHYDVVLLDVMLPDGDGFALCAQLHQRHDQAVILLTARGEGEDRIAGLNLGADDYVVKPFDPRELLARLKAVLRRRQRVPQAPASMAPWHGAQAVRFAHFQYLPDSSEVVLPSGLKTQLTTAEAHLLEVFLKHPRQVFSRSALVGWVKQPGEEVDERLIDRRISRLRRKLAGEGVDDAGAEHPVPLRTAWGKGYELAADVER